MGTIVLKRKCFLIPGLLAAAAGNGALAGALSIGGTALTAGSMIQAHNQGKEAEAQAEAQEKAMQQQTKALNKIAENAKNNPMASMQAAQVMQKGYSESILSRRMFTTPPGMWQNLKGLGRDIWKAWGWNKEGGWAKDALKFGVGGAVLGYGANKWIAHDMKKEGIQMPNQQSQQSLQQHTYSILEKKTKTFDATSSQSQSVMNKTTANKGFFDKHGGKLMTGGFMAFEPGMSLMGYYSQKKQLKAQQQQTQQFQPSLGQRSYSFLGAVGSGARKLGNGAKNLVQSFGLGTADKIKQIGETMKKSNSSYSQNFGKFLVNQRNVVATVGVPLGMWGMGAAFDAGSKISKKPFEVLDKNAYAWDKSQEQQIN